MFFLSDRLRQVLLYFTLLYTDSSWNNLFLHIRQGSWVRNYQILFEPVQEISNNVVCGTSKASDQPAHTRSLIGSFASRLIEYSMSVKLLTEHHLEFLSLKGGCTGS